MGGVSAIALPVKSEVAIGNGDYSARSLRELGRAIAADRPCPVFLFGRSRPSAVVALDAFSDEANAPQLGGALGVGAGLSAVGADGVVREGTLLALRIEDELSLADASATAVEPIVPFAPITEVRRGYIERVGSERALDWLRASGGSAPEGSLLLAMLAVGPERRPLVRGIAGVEPSRGAIHVGDDVEEGETIAIGISTGRVPPEAIEGAQRRALRRLSGAAPRAALLVDPVGRGPRAALAQCGFEERFGSIPWVGIRAAAQIVSGAERPRLAQHTATLSLLCSAS